MGEIDKLKKKIRGETEKNIEIDDSDIPVHETFTKEEHIKELKKGKKKPI